VNSGRTVFAQVMECLPLPEFRACVARYQGEHKVRGFSCLDQFSCLAFARLTYRESLRDIETCLRAEDTMPQTPHIEKHFTASEIVRDIVIGMSDGLTVPFALAAGLTGAVASTGIMVTAGLAEIAAGSIAMGLGGYLAARNDAEHYAAERAREQLEVSEKPAQETAEVMEVFRAYGLTDEESAPSSAR